MGSSSGGSVSFHDLTIDGRLIAHFTEFVILFSLVGNYAVGRNPFACAVILQTH